ncbi:DUF1028 domain-containing protein [candidate division KSB1 bacterium]|nr:DUF1028 domain-containing protein [candidate division KSB1 bacterium]
MSGKNLCMTIVLFLAANIQAQEGFLRPVHTYSIVARDSVTGEMGVAVQSHWFSVGSVVTWAEAGVGAVATQSFVEVSYGPLGLELMKAGKTALEALSALLKADPNPNVRQVAMVDKHGNVAVHTGANCIEAAGHHLGKQYTTQANLMEKDTVWDAMAKAYETTSGDLINRLMASLEAAEQEGGDIRGMQSAAILVVPGTSQGAPWREKVIELRVEDHPRPLEELKRLIRVHRAYEHMNKGDELLAENDMEGALMEYSKASELCPENVEIIYWQAVTMVGAGDVEKALPLFRKVFEKDPNWVELTRRLPASGLLPDDPDLVQKIISVAR